MKSQPDLPGYLPARRQRRALHLFQGVLLLSTAAVFSTLLPIPYNFLQATDASLQFIPSPAVVDPASEWKDDVWPIREQTPWDISTDYPFPRLLEYDVTEGTWLRLDVHPKTGEIVFDMLGDLYCLPAGAYDEARPQSAEAWRARPVLLGVPHDSDPHFSPEGNSIVFRSDAELGVENIWVMAWKGCDEMDVRSNYADEELLYALEMKNDEEELLASGVNETQERKQHQQIGPEQFIWRGNDTLIYSKNVKDANGAFSYSKDVHSGIYAIFSTNLTSKRTTTVVDAFPGGASRPELSRDGRTLAFVRRVRDKEALVLKDLVTGTIHHAWMASPMTLEHWTNLSCPVTRNARGERTAAGTPRAVSFVAHIEKRLAETLTVQTDIKSLETADTQRVHAFTELRVDDAGSRAVFQASGATYVVDVVDGGAHHAQEVPVLHAGAPYYSPSFIAGYDDLVCTRAGPMSTSPPSNWQT
ncbi:hypothetical protein A0H81_04847 [Grifola frondosa]|uniref:Uncharacterized protein n=1 Tax=Grifola frondosa TaxID=5627 RepID=A0A1C7MGK1_GRIFR|nr:hypothetical protein A0H81_04847 [Grifola frondosa]